MSRFTYRWVVFIICIDKQINLGSKYHIYILTCKASSQMLSDGQEPSKGTLFMNYVLQPIFFIIRIQKMYESLVRIFSLMMNSNNG